MGILRVPAAWADVTLKEIVPVSCWNSAWHSGHSQYSAWSLNHHTCMCCAFADTDVYSTVCASVGVHVFLRAHKWGLFAY